MSKQFREFVQPKGRERWPLEFDLTGVERNTEVRTQLKQQQEFQEQVMPQQPSNNRFVSGATIDINRPPREAYNPRDPKNEFPKMLYHPTKKDLHWQAEHTRITKYNALHPEKPEILPAVPAASVLVKNAQEEAAKIKEGWQLRPPALDPAPEESAADEAGEVLCSRGCGQPPHSGQCKKVKAAA